MTDFGFAIVNSEALPPELVKPTNPDSTTFPSIQIPSPNHLPEDQEKSCSPITEEKDKTPPISWFDTHNEGQWVKKLNYTNQQQISHYIKFIKQNIPEHKRGLHNIIELFKKNDCDLDLLPSICEKLYPHPVVFRTQLREALNQNLYNDLEKIIQKNPTWYKFYSEWNNAKKASSIYSFINGHNLETDKEITTPTTNETKTPSQPKPRARSASVDSYFSASDPTKWTDCVTMHVRQRSV